MQKKTVLIVLCCVLPFVLLIVIFSMLKISEAGNGSTIAKDVSLRPKAAIHTGGYIGGHGIKRNGSNENQYDDLDTIVKENQLSGYEILSCMGMLGPYKVLDIQYFAPGQEITGTVTVNHSKFTFKHPWLGISDDETILIFLQEKRGGVGTAVLRPFQSKSTDDSPPLVRKPL